MAIGFTKFDGRIAVTYASEESRKQGKDLWEVVHTFRYFVGDRRADSWVVVPEGFLTDGASVPRFLWSYIPPWGQYGNAAILHDWLCENPFLIVGNKKLPLSNKQVDKIFLEAMKVSNVHWFLRKTIYAGVRFADIIGIR